MTNIWNLWYQDDVPEFQYNFERVFSFLLGWFLLIAFIIFLGGATAAALKSEVAVDGNRKVADRMASLPTRQGNREPELCCSCFLSEVRVRLQQ